MVNKREFRRWQEDNYNFMTPYIVELRETEMGEREIVIELSRNTREKIQYGVSVFERTGREEFEAVDHDLDKSFWSKETAEKYIENELIEKLNNRQEVEI